MNLVDKSLTEIVFIAFYPNFLIDCMDTRIDSCGNCGEELEILNTCMVCEQPSKFQCLGCLHYVDDPIHTECMIFDDSI
jgi:predicted amidophosphoribosyltransferase